MTIVKPRMSTSTMRNIGRSGERDFIRTRRIAKTRANRNPFVVRSSRESVARSARARGVRRLLRLQLVREEVGVRGQYRSDPRRRRGAHREYPDEERPR